MAAPLRLGVAGAVLTFLGIIFGFWGFHKFLAYKINQNVALKKGNDMRAAWSKFPIPLEFRIYLFNVTNPQEVHAGQKPKVQQVGPYFFDEWKEKIKLEDDPAEDTVSFNQRAAWVFQESRSEGLTGEEVITIPHPALLSMVLTVEQQKPGALAMISKALPALFNSPSTVFLTAKVMDILFRGVPINCSSNDFGPKAICTMIRANPKGLKKLNDDIFLFSFFGVKNNTMEEGRFTVRRGIRDAKEVGSMVKFNGKEMQDVWSGPECNALRGTDSTIFPPFIDDSEDIVSFAPDLCRSLGAKFRHKIVYKGIPGNHYTADLGDMSSNPEEKCFCPTPTTCLKKGAFDISKCVGIIRIGIFSENLKRDRLRTDILRQLIWIVHNKGFFIPFKGSKRHLPGCCPATSGKVSYAKHYITGYPERTYYRKALEKCTKNWPPLVKNMLRMAWDLATQADHFNPGIRAPIVLTLPHFYEADQSYLDTVDGLHPEKEKHQIFLNFEPMTGTPLGARKRLQFNIPIHAIKKVALMKELPDALIPLFWVEEGLELDQKFIDILDAQLFRALRIVGVGRWVMVVLGLAMIGGGVGLHYYRKNKLTPPTVTQVSPPPNKY